MQLIIELMPLHIVQRHRLYPEYRLRLCSVPYIPVNNNPPVDLSRLLLKQQ